VNIMQLRNDSLAGDLTPICNMERVPVLPPRSTRGGYIGGLGLEPRNGRAVVRSVYRVAPRARGGVYKKCESSVNGDFLAIPIDFLVSRG
jgi:hypothetical protein